MTISECKEIIKNEKRNVVQIKSKIKNIRGNDLEELDALEVIRDLKSELITRLAYIKECEETLKKLQSYCR